jgi:hypothetical protein
MIDIKNNYKDSILNVWDKHKKDEFILEAGYEYRKYPLAPDHIKKDALLIIGINPSFGKGAQISQNDMPIGFYANKTDADANDISYWLKIKELANYADVKWSHLDLLFIRETNQKTIEKLCISNPAFIQDQLNISFEIIKKSHPKMIIVTNSFASEFFGKKKAKHFKFDKIWQGYDFAFEGENSNFDQEIGTYNIDLNGKKTPIVFSGMLSGQRALDIGSFERLKWQVKMILNN